MAEIKKLSASKISTYKGCSMAFFLQYIEHIKVPGDIKTIFGSAIHYLLERFYDVNYTSAETFSNFWKFYWFRTISGEGLKDKKELEVNTIKTTKGEINIGNHTSLFFHPVPLGPFFHYMKLGKDILNSFYLRHKEKEPPLMREKSFGKKKDEPPICICGIPITGVFDRVDINKNGLYITDYKTNKASPENDSFLLHRNPQFTIYSYACKDLFGVKEKALLFYHLRSGKVFKTHRDEKDYDYIKRLVEDVADGIEKNRFTPFYGFHCGFCEYKVSCEEYSIGHYDGPRINLEGRIKPAEEIKNWDNLPEWIKLKKLSEDEEE
jgi:CRISPR/Cas system-associated exonuclease Cas4 (RecB family)